MDTYVSFTYILQGCFTVSWPMPPWEIVLLGWRSTCCGWSDIWHSSQEIILCMHPANKRRHHSIKSSFTGWAHTQNNPWFWYWLLCQPDNLKLWYLPCKVPCFTWGRISTTHIISVLRNEYMIYWYKWMSPKINSAWQELSQWGDRIMPG